MNYDKAKYHFEYVINAGLNIESAYTHGGMLLAWLIENELISEDFVTQNKNDIKKLKNRNISGPQLYINIDGVLSDFILNENGINFLKSYNNEKYIEDYVTLFNDYNSIYSVADTLDNFNKLSLILDSNFTIWKTNETVKLDNKFDYLQEFILSCLGDDFKFKRKEKDRLLFIKENEKITQGFSVSLTEEKFICVNVFISDENIMQFFDSEGDKYSNWILGAREHDILFGTEINQRFPKGNDYLSLNSTDDLDKISIFIEEYIKNKALVFFKYWQDIRNILPFLETDDNGIISDIFSSHGFYKKVIVWKLCSHPKYEELTINMLNIFSQELAEEPNDKLLKKDYNFYLKILKKLDKIKPIYSWNDDYLIKKKISM